MENEDYTHNSSEFNLINNLSLRRTATQCQRSEQFLSNKYYDNRCETIELISHAMCKKALTNVQLLQESVVRSLFISLWIRVTQCDESKSRRRQQPDTHHTQFFSDIIKMMPLLWSNYGTLVRSCLNNCAIYILNVRLPQDTQRIRASMVKKNWCHCFPLN